MGWLIIGGVIALILVLFILKNTYCTRKVKWEHNIKHFEYSDKLKMPLWVLILMIIVSIIPGLNIMAFIGFIIFGIGFILNEIVYIHFDEKSICGKISKFLNKNIF